MARSLSWRETSPLGRLEFRSLASSLRGEPAIILGLIVIGLLAHGLNMFQFPALTGIDDEGIYASQAWAILREGQLSPYTYVYDHVPGGWILLAGWMVLTGGPHAFGSAIDSGRVLMLLLHVASVVMLYRIARKLGCHMGLAAVGALLFTISPLELAYGRRLLLDNIMLFWCLLSLDLLLDGWGRLSRVTLSGVCFGVAMLTKETAVFLVLPMLFIAWQQRWQHQARFAVFGWLVPMLMVVSFYPLYAALKGELLPAGGAAQFSTSGYGNTGVSLADSLLWQIGRGGGGAFNLDNQFWTLVRSDWLPRDALLLVGGALTICLNLARGCRLHTVDQRRAVATGLLGLLPLLYLARGGIVFDFYILAAIPFLCLNLVVLIAPVYRRLPVLAATGLATGVALAIGIGYFAAGTLQPLYAQAPSTTGRQALTWIKAHVPADAYILTGDDLWTDLREPGPSSDGTDAPGFANVQSYTKVGGDPAIHTGVFHDDWRGVDYLLVSPGLEDALVAAGNTLAVDALHHAHEVQSWSNDGSSLELWKVDKVGATEPELMSGSNAYLAAHFGQDGAFKAADGSVTSESQAYAMLRAVWSGDRAGFARTWQWTSGHISNTEGLLAWKWNGTVADSHSATDADTDTALALLLAGREWGDPAWLADGTAMVDAIWNHDVATVNGTPYVVAGDWAADSNVVTLNPSYFAPYAYHIFQEVDPAHNWVGVVDSGYQVLFDSSAANLESDHSAGLPPDWVGLDQQTGTLVPLDLGTDPTTTYGYDAPRTYWRLALDQRWDDDGRAAAFLSQAGFLDDEVNRSGGVRAIYIHDGSVASTDSSVVGSAGALAALLTLDPDAANRLYASALVGGSASHAGQLYWGDPNDLYAQEWGWFATALYANALTDVWHEGG